MDGGGTMTGIPQGVAVTLNPLLVNTSEKARDGSHVAYGNSFEVYANGIYGARSVLFPTWTLAGGQDDIEWIPGVYDAPNSRWKAVVNRVAHNGEYGTYESAIYKVDGNNATVGAGPGNIKVTLKPGAGTITRSYWTGITGTSIASLTGNAAYPDSPTGTDALSSFEGVYWSNPAITYNFANNYGQDIYGYVVAPATGNYIFWVSGDDSCELWLSTDDQPSHASLVASVGGGSGGSRYRQWTKYASQKSKPVALVAGQRYYIEAIQKEGDGRDSLSVGWSKPGESTTAPSQVIPGEALMPW
jgi:hypothetical protein